MKLISDLMAKVWFSMLLIGFLSLCLPEVVAQTTLLSESFETDGESIRYTSNHYILCTIFNQQDFFFRTNITPANPNMPPDCTVGHGTAVTNIQGSYYWASEDVMSSPGIMPPGDITFIPFNICGYSNLEVSLYLGCANNNNIRWETADSINIKTSIDGGPYRTVGRFFGGAVIGGNLLIDANLNGIVDPAELTPICDISTLTKYTFTVPYSGSTLQLKLDFDQLGGSEELAVDLIEVKGVSAGLAEINVQGGSPLANILDGDMTTSLTNHTSFGTVNVGSNLVRTYTIQNTGSANLNITSITKSGVDAGMFTIGSLSPASPISPTGSATFTVTFAPTATGLKNATINITNSDCNENNYDFAISGTGANACPLTASMTGNTPVSCNGGNNGSLTVTAVNGVANYTYIWSSGASTVGTASVTNTISSLTATNYTVTVTDGNACTASATATISQPSMILATTTQVNVLCFGGSNGSIDLTVSGGTSGYTYDWDNDGSEAVDNDTQDLSSLTAGTYTVTVTDANCCTKTAAATISQPSMISATTTQVNVSCFGGSNGSIDLTVSGGTSGYTYDWDNDGPEAVDNDTQDLSGLTSGTYTVTVTDANGCTKTAAATISQPSMISATTTQVNVLCFGGSNGSIDLTVSGGTSGYTYDWDNDGPEAVDNDTQDLSGLTAGTYTLTVTDVSGCTKTAAATISQPSMISATTTQVNVSCFGGSNGSIDLTVSGGTSGYTYDWDNDGPEAVDNDTQDLSSLTAGTYTVTVTDANGCTKTAAATISQPSMITATATQVNVSCFGGSNGSIDLTVSGGTSGYTYDWDNDGPEAVDNDTQDLSGLTSGTYTVTVTDANGCTKTAAATISQPSMISATTTQVNVLCFGGNNGTIDLSVSGGTIGYTYDWDNDGPEAVDNDTQDLSGLSAGTYTVTVTDANGCTKTAAATISQPSMILATTTQVMVPCFGGSNGSIDLTVSDGTAPYTYDWDNDGPEAVDNDTQDLSSLTAGTYTVTVTDANGCTKTAAATISQPSMISATTTQVNVLCFGGSNGSIDLTVSGGTSGYTYDWDNDGPEAVDNDFQDLSGLTAGTYTVTVTDANGCTKTASATINQPGMMVATTTQVNVSCYGGNNGSIDLMVSGGNGPFTYDWDNDGPEMVDNDTEDLMGLLAGTYTVTVTDTGACTQTTSATVNQPVNGSNFTFIGPGTDFSNPLNWQNGCVPASNLPSIVVTIMAGQTLVLTGNFEGTIVNYGILKGGPAMVGNLINNGKVSPGN